MWLCLQRHNDIRAQHVLQKYVRACWGGSAAGTGSSGGSARGSRAQIRITTTAATAVNDWRRHKFFSNWDDIKLDDVLEH